MRISGNDMKYNIGSIYQKKFYFQHKDDVEESTEITPRDSASFSEKGKQFSRLMSRVQSLDTNELDSKVSELKEAIQDLSLNQLSLDSMSREELQSVYEEINATISHYSEQAEAISASVDTSTLNDSELKDLLHSMKSHTDDLLQTFVNLELMGSKGTPLNLTASNTYVQQQKLTSYTSQMALSAPKSESKDVILLQSLVNALEEDSQVDTSNFYKTITRYVNQYDAPALQSALANV